MATVDSGNHAVNAYRALLADRYFGHLPNNSVVTFVDSNAAAAAGTERLTPIAFLGDGIEHAKKIRPVRQQSSSKLVRILTGCVRQLIDVALHKKCILR